MFALYAFARVTDDLGDSHLPVKMRTLRLNWWRGATQISLGSNIQDLKQLVVDFNCGDQTSEMIHHAGEIFPALQHAALKFSIPSRYFLEIIDGVMADQQKTRFDTYEQVEHYCYLVASAVGLACLHIWEHDGELPSQAAIDCGIAFQLTNILRDILEDSERGRIYLPRQHYERHGLSEDDLLAPRRDDRLRCLILEEVERAEELYRSGWEVWSCLHPDGRRMFSMMWRTYRALLQQIRDEPMKVISHRVGLPFRTQFNLALHHFVPSLFARLSVPPQELCDVRGMGR